MSRAATLKAPAPPPREPQVAPTRWQSEVLRTPREADLCLFGGKGSGKTALVPYLLMRDEQEFGPDCRALYVRKSHGGAQEFMLMLYEALARAYGIRAVSFNSQTGLFKFGRATCAVDQLAEPKDLQKHWGKNYSLILCDEVGEYNGLDLIEKLRASLRPPAGIPARMVLIGNPGGPNHAVLLRRFVAGTTPWVPRIDEKSGRRFIYCPSTYKRQPAHRSRRLPRATARRLRERRRIDEGMGRWFVRRDEGGLLQQRRR